MKYDLSNDLELKNAEFYFSKLVQQRCKIDLSKIVSNRSISLNSYLHVCISLFAIEFGLTLEEAKTLLKRKCSFMVYEKKGIRFLKKTSQLNNKECSDFVEFIRNFASKHNLYIPDALEYKENKFNIDKEISKHKQYL